MTRKTKAYLWVAAIIGAAWVWGPAARRAFPPQWDVPLEPAKWQAVTTYNDFQLVRYRMLNDALKRATDERWTYQQVIDNLGPPDSDSFVGGLNTPGPSESTPLPAGVYPGNCQYFTLAPMPWHHRAVKVVVMPQRVTGPELKSDRIALVLVFGRDGRVTAEGSRRLGPP